MIAGLPTFTRRLLTQAGAIFLLLAGTTGAADPSFKVAATATDLVVEIAGANAGDLELVAMPSWTKPQSTEPLVVLWKGPGATQNIRVPRSSGGRDLLFARLALREANGGKLLRTPQWATDFRELPARQFEFLKTTTKKGLNCVVDVADAAALGVQHANVNISIRQLVALDVGESEFSTVVDGQRVPMHAGYVRYLDEYIGGMTSAGINVTGILLNYIPPQRTPDALIHPDTNVEAAPNHMGAFNMTSEEGVRLYRAAMQFLAERYTQEKREHGCMSGMIIGNEVQSHWFWNNQGEVDEDEVIRDYHVALRLADLIGRSMHSKYRVFASMDHHWTRRMTGFNSKRTMRGDAFLEKLNAESKRAGDFPWAVAFHPYPENLFDAKFWQDKHAPASINAPVITFKNIEVLPAYLRSKEMLFAGAPRRIALTEQGFHRKVGEAGERVQAAALGLGYYKISQMPEIDFFLLHRHQDHPHEGGLNLGVLDGAKRRTQAWNVYRDMDTPKWQETAGFALEVAGLSNWSDILARSDIRMDGPAATPGEMLVYDFFVHGDEAKLSDTADWRVAETSDGADGWLPTILQHPKTGTAPGRAEFTLRLPAVRAGSKLGMRFMSALNAPSQNGVGFRVLVNGNRALEKDQQSREPATHRIDLTSWQGQQVTITLEVDALGNTAHDLGAWVDPRIVVE